MTIPRTAEEIRAFADLVIRGRIGSEAYDLMGKEWKAEKALSVINLLIAVRKVGFEVVPKSMVQALEVSHERGSSPDLL